MDSSNKENKEIEKKCCYCEYATEVKAMEAYLCNRHGAVAYDFTCKKFIFDPLKLSPRLPAKKLAFTAADFGLGDKE